MSDARPTAKRRKRGRPIGTGRPIKAQGEALSETIQVRLTPADVDALYRCAMHRGQELSAFLRQHLRASLLAQPNNPVVPTKSAVASGPMIGA